MIFTDENGKIYEIPTSKYAEFEVSAERASEINEELKQLVSDNNEVAGYVSCAGNLCTYDGKDFFVTTKSKTVYHTVKGSSVWTKMN